MKSTLKGLVTFIVFFVLVVGALVALNAVSDKQLEELKTRWGQAPSQFVEVGGMQVHFRDEGPRDDASPIVLLHGTSSSLHTWDGWVDELKNSRRVIRFDLPGFGLTGPSPNADYRAEVYADFVVQTLDAIGVGEVVLAGNSLGGEIAWTTSVAYPDRIAKLILVDSGGYRYESESYPIAFTIAEIPILNLILDIVSSQSIVRNSVLNVYGDPAKVTPALVSRYYDLMLREGNRKALRQRLSQVEPGKNKALISTVQQPTLIIWGMQDRLIPPSYAEEFDSDISNSELVVFDHLGHVPQEEDPEATVAAVIAFLK